jgi:hypothetical protein
LVSSIQSGRDLPDVSEYILMSLADETCIMTTNEKKNKRNPTNCVHEREKEKLN